MSVHLPLSDEQEIAVEMRMRRDNIKLPISREAMTDYLLYKAGILDKWPVSCVQSIPEADLDV
jgi:hypothetical protein